MLRLLILFLFIQTSCTIGQKAKPEVVQANQTVDHKTDFSPLDTYIQEHIDEGVIPGGTFYIAHKGDVLYDKALGKSNIEEGIDFKRNDIFRIASMTKAFTTVAIMQLYEQGLLQLDDPVSTYIPEFAQISVLDEFNEADSSFTTVPATVEMTIRHLLTHTSGLYYGQFIGGKHQAVYMKSGIDQIGIYTPNLTTIEMARLIAKAPLMHEPGAQWTYGLSMDVLGAVVEVITKKKLSLVFLTEIFYPLGMHNSHFYLPEAKYNMLAPLFTYDADGQLIHSPDPSANFPIFLNKGHYAGGGGASSTAVDYGKFLQALLHKGSLNGKRILSEKTIDLMLTEQISHLNKTGHGMSPAPGDSFCLGHRLFTAENEHTAPFSAGTYSWGGYFNSKWWVDPKKEIVFVGMTNVLPFTDETFWTEMFELVYTLL